MRDFDDFIPGLTFEAWDADAVAQLAVDAGMRYLVPVTKHHDGFCWWDTDAHRPVERAPGPTPRRDRRARRAPRAPRPGLRPLPLAARLGAPRPSRPRALRRRATCVPSSPSSSSGSGRSCSGATGTGATTATWWRADRIVEDYYAAMAGGRARGVRQRPVQREPRGLRGLRVRRTGADAVRRVGAVPRPLVLLLLQPGRARRRPPDRGRARRDAHRGRRQGRQPAAQRRPEGRRHDPGHPGPGAARGRRVGQRERRRDPRVAPVRRLGRRRRPATP